MSGAPSRSPLAERRVSTLIHIKTPSPIVASANALARRVAAAAVSSSGANGGSGVSVARLASRKVASV